MSSLTDFVGGGIKSLQRGTITVSSASVNATVTAVNVSKSILMYLGQSGAAGTTFDGASGVRIFLTDATTVNASCPIYFNNQVVSYQLVEYY